LICALTLLARSIEAITEFIGRLGALVLPVLIATVVVNVALRYGFRMGVIELEELQWHLNALVVMLCMAFALKHDAHVRVDIFRYRMGTRARATVDLLGSLLLLLPFCIGIIWYGWMSFAFSWRIGEGSPMPSGLPMRYLVRLLLIVGFALLAAQAIALAARSLTLIIDPPTTGERGDDH
jgi:TRAP-type mannitol/chloroaromatic compound transport system permease small subunit